MLCQRCKKNMATVHLTEISKEHKAERHLCDDCAKAEGLAVKAQQISLEDIMSGFLLAQKMADGLSTMACKDCGMSYLEFRNKGRLGCPGDYEAFDEGLMPILEKMHGETGHIGKAPRTAPQTTEQRHSRLMELRRRLQQAVQAENYEEAARLRDVIHGESGTQDESADGEEGVAD
ncbi:MAG: UvrB/UvrC motif-containing protein [Planctomycetia bacterium]|nr:UvrB/UvrC motif-containing protein [Planctomycetia bacterium]